MTVIDSITHPEGWRSRILHLEHRLGGPEPRPFRVGSVIVGIVRAVADLAGEIFPAVGRRPAPQQPCVRCAAKNA
jgi:hypothetical protein